MSKELLDLNLTTEELLEDETARTLSINATEIYGNGTFARAYTETHVMIETFWFGDGKEPAQTVFIVKEKDTAYEMPTTFKVTDYNNVDEAKEKAFEFLKEQGN